MALPKTKLREAIFQILFSLDTGHATEKEIIELIMAELKITRKFATEAFNSASAIYEKVDAIDTEISSIVKAYSLDRIQRAERNILRVGVYEILYQKEIPPLVSISEAIRLSNKFSTKEASKFINAILDAVMKKQKGEVIDPSAVQSAFSDLEKATDHEV